jgi:hypothetical protein
MVSVGPGTATLVFYLTFYLLTTMIRNALAYSRKNICSFNGLILHTVFLFHLIINFICHTYKCLHVLRTFYSLVNLSMKASYFAYRHIWTLPLYRSKHISPRSVTPKVQKLDTHSITASIFKYECSEAMSCMSCAFVSPD